MRLNKVDFYLDWPASIKIIDLRRLILSNLNKKGKVIRWSIIDINASADSSNIKKIKINAVLSNSTNS